MIINIFDKSLGQYIVALLLAILILIVYYLMFNNCKKSENFIDLKYEPTMWNRNRCDYMMNKTLEEELEKNKINQSNSNWNLYFPCAYDEINKEIENMPLVKNAKYYIIDNADELVAKEWLWKNVVNHYGIDMAKSMLPNSYDLYDKNDLMRFEKEYDYSKIYIMKKNIQRQEGLKLTRSKDDILNGSNNEYALAQELLQDPYIIGGRKTNMRFYVLVLCKGNEINVYVHKDGFMYYTNEMFRENSLEMGPNITTGYIDRQVYIDNPLTHDDLRVYLDNNRTNFIESEKIIKNQGFKISEVYFNRIYHLIRAVFMSFVGRICIDTKFKKYNNTLFQLFGIDVAVNNKLNPMIIEINKGPDMSAKDERDSKLKHKVVEDVLNVIGAIKTDKSNRFIRVLDIIEGTIQKSDI